MEPTQVYRTIHLLVRLSCFVIGARVLYPALYKQMKSTNGYRSQRKNIQMVMLFVALVIANMSSYQIINWAEHLEYTSYEFWNSTIMTVAITGMTLYGVRMFRFKPPKD